MRNNRGDPPSRALLHFCGSREPLFHTAKNRVARMASLWAREVCDIITDSRAQVGKIDIGAFPNRRNRKKSTNAQSKQNATLSLRTSGGICGKQLALYRDRELSVASRAKLPAISRPTVLNQLVISRRESGVYSENARYEGTGGDA